MVWYGSPKGSKMLPATSVFRFLFIVFAISLEHGLTWAPLYIQEAGRRTRPRSSSGAAGVAPSSKQNDNESRESSSQHKRTCNNKVQGITLKIAVDSQGGVADLAATVSDRFTSAMSLDRVHRLRRDAQAILIGRRTVAFDNPSLTIRRNMEPPKTPPWRVVLDSRLNLLIHRVEQGQDYQLFEDGLPTLVYHCLDDVDEESLNLLESVHLVKVPVDTNNNNNNNGSDNDNVPSTSAINVTAVWQNLQQEWGVTHLMVEGGPAVAHSFLHAGLIDRVMLVHAQGVTFRQPIPSGITAQVLQDANLECLGSFEEQGDETECWVRLGNKWPSEDFSDWP